MKSFYLLLIVSILSSAVLAQSNIPQVVSFSAVVRDANNQPLVNTPVSIRLTFKKGGASGPLVYCALHQDVSNANGFISLQLNRNVLGTGCNGAPSTTFENIPWKEGGFWMEVEYQTVPNTPFTSLGQLELASSFYAFAAGSAEKVNGVNLDGANNGDVLSYNLSTGQWEPKPAGSGLPTGATGNMLVHNGTSWTVLPAGAQGQVLTFCNGQPTWGPCPASLASLTTTTVSSITSTTASSGGNISNDGGAAISARGVVWSTSQNPTIALTTKTVDGTGSGNFTSNLNGLSPGNTYYLRAYATNSAGTSYGNEVSFSTPVASLLSWSAKLLGGQLSAAGSYFASSNGSVYSGSGAFLNGNIIDITYAYLSGPTLLSYAFRDDPSTGLSSTVPAGALETKFANAPITAAQFANISSISDSDFLIGTAPVSSGSPQFSVVETGKVYSFLSGNRKGLILVKAISGDISGTITIDVKVQAP